MFIYKIINTINNKIYIGCTIRSVEDRFDAHFRQRKTGGCKALSRAIIKYGFENFIIEEIEKCNNEKEMFDREIYWIAFYNSTNTTIGYNLTGGGDRGPIFSGENHPMYGRKNEKLSELNKSRIGKKLSPEHKEKVRLKLFDRKLSDESKNKMSTSRKKKWDNGGYDNIGGVISNAKKHLGANILCLNNNKIYDGYRKAAKALNVSSGNISSVINGKVQHTKGYYFVKVTDEHLIF